MSVRVFDKRRIVMNPTEQNSFTRSSNDNQLWTTADVAGFLGCSERFVFILRKRGLPSIQVGTLVRFAPEQVREWLSIQDEDQVPTQRKEELQALAASPETDAAECAASDLFKEFSTSD